MSNNLPVFSSRSLRLVLSSVSDTLGIPFNQLSRISFHSVLLSLIISGFWLLDSLKDPILAATIGIENQPKSKLLSVLTTIVVVSVYDFLTSILSKPSLFLAVSGFYGIVFFIIAALLSDPSIGLVISNDKHVMHHIGYLSYIAVESYGSLMVALFWSFTNSMVNLELAKGAYGLIICFAQIGAIAGSTLATRASLIGIPVLYMVASITVLSTGLLIKVYFLVFKDSATTSLLQSLSSQQKREAEFLPLAVSCTAEDSVPTTNSKVDKKSRSIFNIFNGFYEGLDLISKYKYTWLLLGVSTLYEVVLTVLDYEFKLSGAHYSSTPSVLEVAVATDSLLPELPEITLLSRDKFAKLLGHFGQVTNFVALLLSLFGFSFVVHKLGVRLALMIFPTLLLIGVIVNNLVNNMWILFTLLSVLKAITFSLNEPVKELLYIPTSESIKFKAKAWIDVFGARCAKAFGSYITYLANGDILRLRQISEIPILIITFGYILLVWAIGYDFQHLVDRNLTVGEESRRNSPGSEPYITKEMVQNLPTRNGLKPGDVGYDGYDLRLFEGVFEEDENSSSVEDSRYKTSNGPQGVDWDNFREANHNKS